MATPKKIDDFIAWRLFLYCFRQLQGIRIASGYNTDPFVTMNMEEFRTSGTKFAVLIEVDDHSPQEHGVGGSDGDGPRVLQILTMTIEGSVQVERDIPRKEAFKLEQDVRTAIHSGVSGLKSKIGRSAAFEFGECPHDGGILTPDNEAGFRLLIGLKYPQGSNW